MTPIVRQILLSKKILAKDSFDRANGAIGISNKGGTWLVGAGGSYNIESNKCANQSEGPIDLATLDIGRANCVVSIEHTILLNNDSSSSGIVARSDGTVVNRLTFKYQANAAAWQLVKTISNVTTMLGSYGMAIDDGLTWQMKLTCKGNNFQCSLNGVVVINVTDDNVLKTNTRFGLISYRAGVSKLLYENFKCVEA